MNEYYFIETKLRIYYKAPKECFLFINHCDTMYKIVTYTKINVLLELYFNTEKNKYYLGIPINSFSYLFPLYTTRKQAFNIY